MGFNVSPLTIPNSKASKYGTIEIPSYWKTSKYDTNRDPSILKRPASMAHGTISQSESNILHESIIWYNRDPSILKGQWVWHRRDPFLFKDQKVSHNRDPSIPLRPVFDCTRGKHWKLSCRKKQCRPRLYTEC